MSCFAYRIQSWHLWLTTEKILNEYSCIVRAQKWMDGINHYESWRPPLASFRRTVVFELDRDVGDLRDKRRHVKRREPLSSWGLRCHSPESPCRRGSHVLLACQKHKSEMERLKKKPTTKTPWRLTPNISLLGIVYLRWSSFGICNACCTNGRVLISGPSAILENETMRQTC